MKYIFIGDIFGKTGRRVIEKFLPKYIAKYKPDYIFANSENITHGSGIKISHLDQMEKAGIRAFTGGNHTFRNPEIYEEFEKKNRQIRACNYPEETAGKGYLVIDEKVLLISVLGNVFMKDILDCPIRSIEKILKKFELKNYEIILDIHAETTSEKRIISNYFDGKIHMVVGSHTHVQTNDARILPNGTGHICDMGFNGPVDSIIGLGIQPCINSYYSKLNQKREVPEGKGEFNGVFFEIKNGKCIKVEAISEVEDDYNPSITLHI